jgi:hypothetical protein
MSIIKEMKTMHDMLTAFYLVRHFELRQKEMEPYREFMPEKRPSIALRLFRKMRSQGRYEE